MIITVLFWFGVIGAVREWRYAKKIGAPIARAEKWYLVGSVTLAVAVSLIGDLTRLSRTRTTFPFLLAVALIVWAARQMVRRARPRESAKTITTGQ